MKHLSSLTPVQLSYLQWLRKEMVQGNKLSGPEAWSVFSSPGKKHVLKRQGNKILLQLTDVQKVAFKEIKAVVIKTLLERHRRACVYCCRPVGNYGYGWQIDHVKPKSKYRAGTFSMANLVVSCVDCNSWKGVHVDNQSGAERPVIIDPLGKDFDYAQHLRFVQLSTERFTFAKYVQLNEPGPTTYEKLRFDLIERSTLLNGIDARAADLHERLNRLMTKSAGLTDEATLLEVLSRLKEAIYRRDAGAP